MVFQDSFFFPPSNDKYPVSQMLFEPALPSTLVFWGWHNKRPQIGWLNTAVLYCLTAPRPITSSQSKITVLAGPCSLWDLGVGDRSLPLPSFWTLAIGPRCFWAQQLHHSSLCFFVTWHSPCAFSVSSYKDTCQGGLRGHPSLVWPFFNSLHLQGPYFQVRSRCKVLGIRDSTYCGEHSSPHNNRLTCSLINELSKIFSVCSLYVYRSHVF